MSGKLADLARERPTGSFTVSLYREKCLVLERREIAAQEPVGEGDAPAGEPEARALTLREPSLRRVCCTTS